MVLFQLFGDLTQVLVSAFEVEGFVFVKGAGAGVGGDVTHKKKNFSQRRKERKVKVYQCSNLTKSVKIIL